MEQHGRVLSALPRRPASEDFARGASMCSRDIELARRAKNQIARLRGVSPTSPTSPRRSALAGRASIECLEASTGVDSEQSLHLPTFDRWLARFPRRAIRGWLGTGRSRRAVYTVLAPSQV